MSLTAERARELLVHDPITGGLTWRVSYGSHAKRGKPAGHHNKTTGYHTIRLDKKLYQAHRVIWLMLHGEWPNGEIDHTTRKRAHNAAGALRDVTSGINKQNIIKCRADSEIGLKGVRFDKRRGHFRATIRVGGRIYHLGKFDNAQLAHEAYLNAKAQLHPGWADAEDYLARVKASDNHLMNERGVRRVRCDSGSGIVGVRQLPGGRWLARLTWDKKKVSLGTHETAELARSHYVDAKSLLQAMTAS